MPPAPPMGLQEAYTRPWKGLVIALSSRGVNLTCWQNLSTCTAGLYTNAAGVQQAASLLKRNMPPWAMLLYIGAVRLGLVLERKTPTNTNARGVNWMHD
jgi:hypothetical protein